MSTVISNTAFVAGKPPEVFGYLHDPEARSHWDRMSDLVRLEAERPAVGVRVHFRGRRTAPSWVGEFVEYTPPTRSVVRLVEGVGMPFSDFRQTIAVAPAPKGSTVELALEYSPRGLLRLVDIVTVRPKMARATRASLRSVAAHFA